MNVLLRQKNESLRRTDKIPRCRFAWKLAIFTMSKKYYLHVVKKSGQTSVSQPVVGRLQDKYRKLVERFHVASECKTGIYLE